MRDAMSARRLLAALLTVLLVSMICVPSVSLGQEAGSVEDTETAAGEVEAAPAEAPPAEEEPTEALPSPPPADVPLAASLVAVAGNLFGDAYEVDNTVAQANLIVAGVDWQSHTIHVLADEDWLKFEAVAGGEYEINTYLGDPLFATKLSLYEADGTTLITSNTTSGFDSTYSKIDFNPTAGGTYYVKVTQATGVRCGAYKVNVSGGPPAADAYEADDTAATAKTFVLGSTQERTFHVSSDDDWVAVNVIAGTRYLFETKPGEYSLDTYIHLYDSDGTTLIESDDDDGTNYYSFISYTATETETIFLLVQEYADAALGRYRLTISTDGSGDAYEVDDSFGQASPITTDGVAQEHSVHASDNDDFVVFQAKAGTFYTIETRESSFKFDVETELLDSDGTTQLDYDDDGGVYRGSLITYTAVADGPLYVKVYSYDHESTGCYTVSVTGAIGDAFESDDTYEQAKPAALDVTQARTFHVETDADWIFVDVVDGLTYTFDTRHGDLGLDTFTTLFDSDGTTIIVSDDDGGPEAYSHIEFEADANKRVYLQVAPFAFAAVGGYRFTVDCSDTASPITTTDAVASYPVGGGTITLSASDPAPGVGVAATYYTIDGGAKQTYAGPIVVTTGGTHALRYWSVDKTGNSETEKAATFTVAIPPVKKTTTRTSSSTDGEEETTVAATSAPSAEPTPTPAASEDEEDDAPVIATTTSAGAAAEDDEEAPMSILWFVVGGLLILLLLGGLLKVVRSK